MNASGGAITRKGLSGVFLEKYAGGRGGDDNGLPPPSLEGTEPDRKI